MATKCIDRTDQTTLNNLALVAGPVVDGNGVYNENQIDAIAKEIADNIKQDAERNPVQIAFNRYGNAFYEVAPFINGDFKQSYTGEYDDLSDRYVKGNITNIEIAEFMQEYNYTPDQITNTNNYEKLAREMDNYYKNSFADSLLGGICNTLQQFFGAIDSFYSLLGTIDGLLTDAAEFIAKVRSYESFAEFIQKEIIDKLIEEIRKKIVAVINAVIQDVRDAIENFNILGLTLEQASTKAVKEIMTYRELSCTTLSPDNQKDFIKRIEAGIDYFVSKIENIDLESVQLMVARICAFGASIEALIKDINRPLDNFGVNYERIVRRIQNMGKIGTSTAIAAGAIRYSPEARNDKINSLKELWDGKGGEPRITPSNRQPVVVPPITKEEYQDLPRCGSVMAGKDERIKVQGDWIEDLGPDGYARVDLDVKVYLMRVQKEMNQAFTIQAGWRNKEYNEKIGADKDSPHLSGLVIDIVSEGIDLDKFSELAFRSGFKHVVEYKGYIHLDIREMAQ